MRDALERYGRVAAMQADIRVAVTYRHVRMTMQVLQGPALKHQLVMPGDEVLDDVSADLVVSKHRRQVTCRAVHYGRAAGVRIAAGTGVRNQ